MCIARQCSKYQKIDFRGKSINKSTDPLWYIFPGKTGGKV